ncbi:PAS domain S-box protein [Flavobacterium sp.]|uniref:PAS domain S-box protein n=1 Tax=Flavobacterium sp. TaxID=239 RepID=UPI0025E1EFFC|nr:PAS domain S-box protein [Flavobacterium sp.]
MENKNPDSNLQFLSGGGEMGQLIREKDWSKTLLGAPPFWPQSLRTTLGIILNSKFPMFLFWEKELICFYNDAYLPSLGNEGKHPAILGMKGEDAWKEIWDTIKPLIDQVLEGGEATWSEDQLIPIYRNGNIEDVYWTFSYSPVMDELGKPAGVFVACTETTDKVLNHNKLKESKMQFQSIANLVPDVLWDSEADGSTNWYNQRWLEYTGQRLDEAIGWGWIDAIHPEDREGSAKRYSEAVEAGRSLRQEHRIRRHDGEYRWFAISATPLKDDNGQVIKMYGAATDIHDRKQAEEALRNSEEKYRSIFENIDQGFSIHELIIDEGGNVTDVILEEVNEAFEKHTGLKNVQGKKVSEIVPNLEPVWLDAMTQAYKYGETQLFEAYNSDTNRWITSQYSRIGGAESRLLSTFFTDITERKQSEEVLRNKESRLRIAAEAAELGVWEWNPAKDEVTWENERMFEIYGRTREQGPVNAEMFMTEVVHPDDAKRFKTDLEASLTSGILNYTGRFYRGDGELRWITFTGKMEYAEDFTHLRMPGVATDVTKRIQAEQELRKSEEKYRSIFESIDEGFCIHELIIDENGTITDLIFQEVNAAFEQHTGVKNAQGKRVRELFPQVEQHWLDSFEIVYKTGEPVRLEGYQADAQRWFTTQYSRIGGEGSKLIAAVFYDITERKNTERKQTFLLKLNEVTRLLHEPIKIQEAAMKLLAEELNVMRVAYVEVDDERDQWEVIARYEKEASPAPMSGRISDFSSSHLEIYRAGRTVIINDAENEPHPEAYRAIEVRALLAAPVVKSGKIITLVIVYASAPRNWTTTDVQILEELAERTWNAVKRVKAEEALRETKEQLELSISAGKVGIWTLDVKTKYLHWNKQQCDLYGIKENEFDCTPETFWEFVLPEDKQPLEKESAQQLADRKPELIQQFRITRKDGKQRWIESRNRTQFDKHGMPPVYYRN